MAADWWPFLLFSNPKLQFIARLNDMVRGNLFGQQEVFGIKNQGVSSHSNDFVLPSKVELDRAMSLAIETHEKSLFYDKDLRKSVLEQIIEELKIAKHPLRQAYMLESNLSAERFDQEFNRVIHQIQQYVSFLSQKDGFRQFISIQDKFQDDQTALRKVGVPLGPIVVFGASNFPLAYSTGTWLALWLLVVQLLLRGIHFIQRHLFFLQNAFKLLLKKLMLQLVFLRISIRLVLKWGSTWFSMNMFMVLLLLEVTSRVNH